MYLHILAKGTIVRRDKEQNIAHPIHAGAFSEITLYSGGASAARHPPHPACPSDHIEGELSQLNHQRNMVQLGLMKAGETMTGVDTPAPPVSAVQADGRGGGRGGSGGGRGGGDTALRDAADKEIGFALEMQIQIKRAEREKKRQVKTFRSGWWRCGFLEGEPCSFCLYRLREGRKGISVFSLAGRVLDVDRFLMHLLHGIHARTNVT